MKNAILSASMGLVIVSAQASASDTDIEPTSFKPEYYSQSSDFWAQNLTLLTSDPENKDKLRSEQRQLNDIIQTYQGQKSPMTLAHAKRLKDLSLLLNSGKVNMSSVRLCYMYLGQTVRNDMTLETPQMQYRSAVFDKCSGLAQSFLSTQGFDPARLTPPMPELSKQDATLLGYQEATGGQYANLLVAYHDSKQFKRHRVGLKTVVVQPQHPIGQKTSSDVANTQADSGGTKVDHNVNVLDKDPGSEAVGDASDHDTNHYKKPTSSTNALGKVPTQNNHEVLNNGES